MFTNVLLPVDINHPASWSKALPVAADIVRRAGGTLHILAVLPDFGQTLVSGFFPDDFERTALVRAKAALDGFVAANAPTDIAVKGHLAHGHIHEEILKAIGATSVDLVVIASHPPDQMREMLVGSNASRVVRTSPVSVLVVRG